MSSALVFKAKTSFSKPSSIGSAFTNKVGDTIVNISKQDIAVGINRCFLILLFICFLWRPSYLLAGRTPFPFHFLISSLLFYQEFPDNCITHFRHISNLHTQRLQINRLPHLCYRPHQVFVHNLLRSFLRLPSYMYK